MFPSKSKKDSQITSAHSISYRIFSRLFKETAQLYGKFVLVQLIGATVFLSCSIFQMDLVSVQCSA